jgi:hypothetical protein
VATGWIKFGTYWHFAVSGEAANGAAAVASAATAQTSAQTAQAAAQAASSAAAASAAAAIATDDNAIAAAVASNTSATRAALNSRYIQTGGLGGAAAGFVDNGDGGYTSSPYKLAGWQWAKDTFARLVDAVGLATASPLAPSGAVGFPGTGNTATRVDHQHPSGPGKPGGVGLSGMTTPMHPLAASNVTPFSLSRMLLCPIYIRRPDRASLVCTTIGVNVTAAATAGGTVRFGLYGCNADGSINLANLVFQSGEIASTSTGYKSFAYTTAIPEGLYWAACVAHTALSTWSGSNHGMVMQGGSPGLASEFRYVDGVTGALPTTGSTNVGGDGSPALFFAVA